MRIVIITSTFKPELSGIAETINKRVREISRMGGHDILILGPDYAPVKNSLPDVHRWVGDIYDRVRVETYPSDAYAYEVDKADTRRIVHFWQHSLDEQIHRFAPDIVHVDEPERLFGLQGFDGYNRRVGISYARRHGIPVTSMWHTNYIKYADVYLTPAKRRIVVPIARRLTAWIYNSYDVTVCNSADALRLMRELGVRNARFVRSVGIDTENFRPLNLARQNDDLELLYVGRVTPEKSLPVLFEAFRILEKQHARIHLRVVGDGPALESLRAKYASPRVIFDGRIENDQLPAVFNAADIFINPSHTETFTQTALEAAACGLPIVVSAGGGNFETVRAGVNGEFFEPESVDGLVQKLELLITDPDKRRAYAANSPALAEPFSIAAVARIFIDLWTGLAPRPRRS